MQFLKPESSLMQFLGKVADIMLLNVLLLLFSLPILTAGAAMTAAHKVAQDMVLKEEHGIIKRFFRTFLREFKQSTILWILFLLVCGVLVYDALLVFFYCEGALAGTLYVFLGFLAFLVVGTAIYAFALIARYENTLRNHLRNGFFLMIGKIHRTIPAVILGLLPPAIPFFFTGIFIRFIYLWIFLLFGLSFYGISYLIKPVLLLNQPEQAAPEAV